MFILYHVSSFNRIGEAVVNEVTLSQVTREDQNTRLGENCQNCKQNDFGTDTTYVWCFYWGNIISPHLLSISVCSASNNNVTQPLSTVVQLNVRGNDQRWQTHKKTYTGKLGYKICLLWDYHIKFNQAKTKKDRFYQSFIWFSGKLLVVSRPLGNF